MLHEPAPPTISEVFAAALTALGNHAASMDQRDEELHDACPACETMKLLSRVSEFGGRLRATEKRLRAVQS